MRDKRLDDRPTSEEELILIRAGHHLWRLGKRLRWQDKAISSALETIWKAKEEIRRPLRKTWLEFSERRIETLRKARKK